ncbi:gamma-glutamylcyclotransferase family protein [Pyxidicoccus sp. 3LFB2]
MWRLIAWRAGFEAANLRGALRPDPTPVRMFGYGAIVDASLLRDRHVRPLAVQPLCLRDWRLTFDAPSPREGVGFACVEPAPGALVWGKLLTLTASDAQRMHYYEQMPFLNRYRLVWHEQDGERFCFYGPTVTRPGLRPDPGYLKRIVQGLEAMRGPPHDYLQRLRATPTRHEERTSRSARFLVDPAEWPEPLRPVLGRYDQLGIRAFESVFQASLTEWMVRARVAAPSLETQPPFKALLPTQS